MTLTHGEIKKKNYEVARHRSLTPLVQK